MNPSTLKNHPWRGCSRNTLYNCANCGKAFARQRSNMKTTRRPFCSRECSAIGQRK